MSARRWASSAASLAAVDALTGAGLLGIIFGLLFIVGAILVWLQLLVRSALIYILIVLAPLGFATRAHPGTRPIARRTIEMGVALILSKFGVAVAFGVGAAAIESSNGVGAGEGVDLAGMMTGVAVMLMAAFMPWVIWKAIPDRRSRHRDGGRRAGTDARRGRGRVARRRRKRRRSTTRRARREPRRRVGGSVGVHWRGRFERLRRRPGTVGTVGCSRRRRSPGRGFLRQGRQPRRQLPVAGRPVGGGAAISVVEPAARRPSRSRPRRDPRRPSRRMAPSPLVAPSRSERTVTAPTAPAGRTYRLSPPDRTGWMFGLSLVQLLVVGCGSGRRDRPDGLRLVPVGFAVMAVVGALGTVRVHGASLVELIPNGVRFVRSSRRGSTTWLSAAAGRSAATPDHAPPALAGLELLVVDAAAFGVGRPGATHRRVPRHQATTRSPRRCGWRAASSGCSNPASRTGS